jgi:hypothetical protein
MAEQPLEVGRGSPRPLYFWLEPMVGCEPTTYGLQICHAACQFMTVIDASPGKSSRGAALCDGV